MGCLSHLPLGSGLAALARYPRCFSFSGGLSSPGGWDILMSKESMAIYILSSQQLATGSAALLVSTVLVVGVLHTIVPDHWVPITLIARQRGWTRRQTARAAFQAGTGHVVTTLILAAIVWLAGVAFAAKFGHWVDTVSSIALIAFGLWIAISSWIELHAATGQGHSQGPHEHTHDFSHLAGPEGTREGSDAPEFGRNLAEPSMGITMATRPILETTTTTTTTTTTEPPRSISSRTALISILGSSPML